MAAVVRGTASLFKPMLPGIILEARMEELSFPTGEPSIAGSDCEKLEKACELAGEITDTPDDGALMVTIARFTLLFPTWEPSVAGSDCEKLEKACELAGEMKVTPDDAVLMVMIDGFTLTPSAPIAKLVRRAASSFKPMLPGIICEARTEELSFPTRKPSVAGSDCEKLEKACELAGEIKVAPDKNG
jgi:hypothetical protein